MEMSIEFDGFWALSTPGQAAGIIAELYGADAVKAAEQCMETASADHRYDDYCFWQGVLERLADSNRRHRRESRS